MRRLTRSRCYEYPKFIASFSSRAANARPYNGHGYGIEFYGTDATLFIDRSGFEIISETKPDPASELQPPHVLRMKSVAEPARGSPVPASAHGVNDRPWIGAEPAAREELPRLRQVSAAPDQRRGDWPSLDVDGASGKRRAPIGTPHRVGRAASGARHECRGGERVLTRAYRAPWGLT